MREQSASSGLPGPSGMARSTFLFSGWAALILGALLLVYQQSYHTPFIFDDIPAIVDNAHLRRLWPIWEAMTAPPASPLSGRPIVSLTFAINYRISGLDPWSYHVGNLLLHALNAILLLALLRRVFELPKLRSFFTARLGASMSPSWALHLAGAITLLWAVHPLNSESVVYVTQRTELLVSFFYLATLYAAARAWTTPRPTVWYTLAVAACALGMASKEVMVSAPLMVLLLDRTLAAESFREALKRRGAFYLGLAATWGVLILIMLTGPRADSVGYKFNYTAESYLMTQMRILTFYLRTTFWPTGLAIYHDFSIPSGWRSVLTQAVLIGSLGLATLCLLLVGKPGSRLRAWALPGCLFFMVLAPTSSVVPIATEPAAERRMYLPLIAVLAVVVLLLFHGLRRLSARATWVIAPALLLVTVSALGVKTFARVQDYQSGLSIWEAAVREYPRSALLRNILAIAYEHAGREEEALAMVRSAIAADPRHADAHFNLGRLLLAQGDLPGAKAALEEAVARLPGHHEAWLWKARAALQEGDPAQARVYADKAQSIHGQLPEVLVTQGLIAMAMEQYPRALALFERAIQLPGRSPEAFFQIGQILERMNQPAQAAQAYESLLQQFPGDVAGHHALGLLLLRAGELDLARGHFEAALRRRPDLVAPRIRLAWTLAIHPQTSLVEWQEALDLAQATVRQTRQRDPAALEALAAALARLGRFEEAISAQQTALQVAQEIHPAGVPTGMARRLELYQRQQPHVQPAGALFAQP